MINSQSVGRIKTCKFIPYSIDSIITIFSTPFFQTLYVLTICMCKIYQFQDVTKTTRRFNISRSSEKILYQYTSNTITSTSLVQYVEDLVWNLWTMCFLPECTEVKSQSSVIIFFRKNRTTLYYSSRAFNQKFT